VVALLAVLLGPVPGLAQAPDPAPPADAAPVAAVNGDPAQPATDLPPAPLDADESLDLDWDQGPVSAAARRMLDRVRNSVVRIRGFYGGNLAEAFHGSAFAVGPEGLLLTNYHVVARAALFPGSYRLEYATGAGAVGPVTILAVDVIHDLALVRAGTLNLPPLKLRAEDPPRGDRVYAVGYPLNLGLAITEGIGNGRRENEFIPRLYYAGPMTPGMSGGPALDSRGRVIGVNVAFSTRGQLVSFVVPAEFALPLLERSTAPLAAGGFRSEVARQLRQHQAAVLGALPARFPVQRAAGYALPAELAPFVDCTAVAVDPPVRRLLVQSVSCRAGVGLSVEPGLQAGDFQFSHDVLVADGLRPLQFAEQLRRATAARAARGVPTPYTNPFVCRNATVNLNDLQAVVTLCARSYRLYDGLYDVALVATSLNEPLQGFVSAATLRGVDFDGGVEFSRRFLRAIRWTR